MRITDLTLTNNCRMVEDRTVQGELFWKVMPNRGIFSIASVWMEDGTFVCTRNTNGERTEHKCGTLLEVFDFCQKVAAGHTEE